MWRLKLKETLERFTVLDCKNWTCGTPKNQQQQKTSCTTCTSATDEKSTADSGDINELLKCKTIDNLSFGPEIFLSNWKTCSSKRKRSSGSSNDDEEKEKNNKITDNECHLSEDILGAITWSGAIIFGWYASQILCTRRRHELSCNFYDDQHKYLKYLYVPKRTIYSNINSHLVFALPIQPETSVSDRIKYVKISSLDNKLSDNSESNNNLNNQSQCELSLQEITNSSHLAQRKINRAASSTSLQEYSTSTDISSTDSRRSKSISNISSRSSSRQINFLNNDIVTVPYRKQKENLYQINNSRDSSESSINSITSSTENEIYSTEDSSSSFIEFRDNSSDFSSSEKRKIYPKADLVSSTVEITPLTSSTSVSSTETPKVNKTVSELVQHIAAFEYTTAAHHINNKDYIRAIPHLKRATTHQHPNGIFNLGLCYEKGLGVRRNLDVAMECYQKASHLGHPKATFNLGVFYAQGLGGLPKNIDMARKCIITAAKLGQPEAISFLNSMAVNDVEIAKYLKQEKGRSTSIDSGL